VDKIKHEIHKIRVALLDHSSPEYPRYWAAQQALAWAMNPNDFAPPFDAIKGSGAAREDCLAQSHTQSS
jgi:hypothetical protein